MENIYVDSSMPDAVGMNSFARGASSGVNTIQLDALCEATEALIDNCQITLVSGLRAPQFRTITSYDPVTKIATVNSNWTGGAPDDTTLYKITRGNNANDGSTWAKAVADIDYGIGKIGASTTATIYVAPGNYSAEPANRVSLDSRVNGKTVIVKKYAGKDAAGAGAACPVSDGACTFVSTNSFSLWLKATATSGTFLWEGIDIQNENTTSICFAWDDVNSTAQMTIKDCILYAPDSVAGIWPLIYMIDTTHAGVSRVLTLDNVTFAARCNKWLLAGTAASITIKNCIGTARATPAAPDQSPIELSQTGSSCPLIVIENNTFTTSYSSAAYYLFRGSALTSGTILFRNNHISGTADVMVFLGTATGTPKVIAYGNTFRLTTTTDDVTGFVIGNPLDTVDTVAAGPVIVFNDISITGTFRAAGHSVGIFVGRGVTGGLVLGNKVYGDACNQAIFLHSEYCTVALNQTWGNSGIILERAAGNNVIFNTCYSDTGENTHGALNLRDGSDGAYQPLNNNFIGNAVHGGGASTNAIVLSSHEDTMTVSSNFLDWNRYFLDGSGEGGLGVIDTVEHGDRTPLEFIDWSTFTGGTQFSDEHSEITNPGDLDPERARIAFENAMELGRAAGRTGVAGRHGPD